MYQKPFSSLSYESNSIKQIILSHLNRISVYIFQSQSSSKDKDENYIYEDKREILCRAFDFLIAALLPHFDDEMKKNFKDFEEKLKKLEDEVFKRCVNNLAYEKSKGSSDKYSFIKWKKFLIEHNIASFNKSNGDYEYYIEKKYRLHLENFQNLNFLLERKDYLEGVAFGETKDDDELAEGDNEGDEE